MIRNIRNPLLRKTVVVLTVAGTVLILLPVWVHAAIRDNLESLDDAAGWWRAVSEPLEPLAADPAVLAAAAALLPSGDLGEAAWGPWTKAVSAATGKKGRELFLPLRLALTGRDHGPEMKKLLPFIGRERALARLGGQRA